MMMGPFGFLAERVGFEPTRVIKPYAFSRRVHSTELCDLSTGQSITQAGFRAKLVPVLMQATCGSMTQIIPVQENIGYTD